MIWILLLAGLTSSICGAFVVKRTFYQAEEDDNITIRWDSRTKTDMSSTNLVCFLQSEPLKRLYELVNSVEVPESQHQQFAGRVQCDKDALREGRIRLHLSRVTTDDSGHYWCDLAANYDKIMRRWVLETTERFVLNVAQTNDGENSDTPKPELAPTKGRSTWCRTSIRKPRMESSSITGSCSFCSSSLGKLDTSGRMCLWRSTTKTSRPGWMLHRAPD
ncbi:uncharacterized protein LOC122869701 isoform X2 [Siniperca chuatsi]|uniref:uncharacterized protein LOC122869701 isoform X2 n=1 Tax=Siniperca chuatsi TaxID=119488 RepID=UPI001CE16E78|nr:uncharacterized protein LOC122869701 isoform X2 [Siniperca chuatsi]